MRQIPVSAGHALLRFLTPSQPVSSGRQLGRSSHSLKLRRRTPLWKAVNQRALYSSGRNLLPHQIAGRTPKLPSAAFALLVEDLDTGQIV